MTTKQRFFPLVVVDFPELNLDRDLSLVRDVLDGEFDPGSGRTLAACLTHASRTMKWGLLHGLVANG